ncbi:MAG: M48 family metalloprotease [Nannocystaceae bacterium]
MRPVLDRLVVGVFALLWLLGCACAWNPATRRLDFNLVSEAEELELGRDNDREVVAAAGLYEGDLAAYVLGIGERLAAVSERPGLPWTFRLLDAPEVNAFALPGGYVYVTRGIVAHLDSEAELAAVLGHEIGHVTGRHGVVQYSRARVAQRSVGVLRVLDPGMRHVGAFAGATAGLALLRHSRADEDEADLLALRYLGKAGYAPAAMGDVLGLLVYLATNQGPREPMWLSTHPEPADRAATVAGELRRRGLARDLGPDPAFLARLDGMIVGDDPRLGLVVGERELWRPRAGYRLELPEGWSIEYDRTMAIAADADGELALLVGPAEGDDLKAVEEAFLSSPSVRARERFTAVGPDFPATGGYFDFAGRSGQLSGVVVFCDLGGSILVMMAAGAPARFAARKAEVEPIFATLRRLDPGLAASVTPDRLALVRPESATPLAALAGAPALAERSARLNRLAASAVVEAEVTVKIVRPGRRP